MQQYNYKYSTSINSKKTGNLQIPVFEQIRGGVMATIQRERLKAKPKNNRGEMLELLSVSIPTIRRAIAKLKKLNLIERIGSDKTGYWIVKHNKELTNTKI